VLLTMSMDEFMRNEGFYGNWYMQPEQREKRYKTQYEGEFNRKVRAIVTKQLVTDCIVKLFTTTDNKYDAFTGVLVDTLTIGEDGLKSMIELDLGNSWYVERYLEDLWKSSFSMLSMLVSKFIDELIADGTL